MTWQIALDLIRRQIWEGNSRVLTILGHFFAGNSAAKWSLSSQCQYELSLC
jgi:hypothetical protein